MVLVLVAFEPFAVQQLLDVFKCGPDKLSEKVILYTLAIVCLLVSSLAASFDASQRYLNTVAVLSLHLELLASVGSRDQRLNLVLEGHVGGSLG